jgi:hypothetical protein
MAKQKNTPTQEAPKEQMPRADFLKHARPVSVKIGDFPLAALVKEFSTGSIGWYATAKAPIEVNGQVVMVQVGLNLTVIGSKSK